MASLLQNHTSLEGPQQIAARSQEEVPVNQYHYIGIDVGTGSARACIVNAKGDIVGLASENIGLWQPEHGFYVRITGQSVYQSTIPHMDVHVKAWHQADD